MTDFPRRAARRVVRFATQTTEPEPGRVLVAVSGEVELATAGRLADALEAALGDHRPSRVEVDLAAVGFMDSSGVRVLLAAQASAHAAGCRLVVVNPHPRVRRVLAVTAVLEHLGLPPD